jgi:predicted nucleotide-binding protein (sugar kinase/HSP70/actin superfamily)
MWVAGGKYGSVDPCYPSKVAQAHIHDLLFDKHRNERLDYIYFPCITHLPTYLEGVQDSTACPIVAGTPKVVQAAFTKEVDFFAERGIVYVDAAATMNEPLYLKRQLFEAWGERLEVTEDESDFAADRAWEALAAFEEDLQHKGRAILEEVEAEDRLALLLVGRPYHNDPGLNHGITEEFQALGYPVLSLRSLPRDPEFLARYFEESPLDIGDVWPENYSANSAQKVWAVKLAARHPNIAILDLSSFKCGHDAPTYGIIDSIVNTANTPYSALHDIDANKPTGSMKIRVKTYAYSLSLREEGMRELALRHRELQERIDQKQRELEEEARRRQEVSVRVLSPSRG